LQRDFYLHFILLLLRSNHINFTNEGKEKMLTTLSDVTSLGYDEQCEEKARNKIFNDDSFAIMMNINYVLHN
jgi:hypothetical protein